MSEASDSFVLLDGDQADNATDVPRISVDECTADASESSSVASASNDADAASESADESSASDESGDDQGLLHNESLDTGVFYAWGQAEYGQLGLRGSSFWQPSLCSQLRGRSVRQVAVGFRHTLVLLDSGRVFGFGANSFGQLGLATGVCRKTPVRRAARSCQRVVLDRVCSHAHTHSTLASLVSRSC